MGLITSPLQIYLYQPSTGARAITYLLLVWLVSILLYQEISQNFFSNIKNPLNQYFVKYAWGWTLLPLSMLLVLYLPGWLNNSVNTCQAD
jgi:hypothetical protein